jgi:SAM-dependent methyltransferase
MRKSPMYRIPRTGSRFSPRAYVIEINTPAKFRSGLKALYTKLRFAGIRYKCPFCGSRLRTLLPHGWSFPVLREKKVVGAGYRQNSLCPVCGSEDRERLLYLYLVHKTDILRKPQTLLHIAPEERVRSVLVSKTNLDYLTADLYKQNVSLRMDVTDIHFPDGSFDAIICNHVLEHVIDDRKAVLELFRVLRPGGWAILQVPVSLSLNSTYEDSSITTPAAREQAFGQRDHVRIYAEDYAARLAQAGFQVNAFKWTAEAEHFGGARNTFGLIEEESVYLASKP